MLLSITWPGGTVQETEDAYAFGPFLGDLDLHLFNEGRHWDLGRVFGAQPKTVEGVAGVGFSVWAPNARRVSVIGDFNGWDGRRHPMRLRHGAGMWELFVPRLGPGTRLQVRDRRRRRQRRREGRSDRAPDRIAARDRRRSSHPADYQLDRRRLDGGTQRGASAPTRRSRSTRSMPARGCGPRARAGHARLARARRSADPLCQRDGLHPCRAAADHGASLRADRGATSRCRSSRRRRASARPTISPISSTSATAPGSA